ncbi:MAG: ComEC/Rec2 family competence protein [Hyphomicrobiaceae bacterium]|nr:ComEC/Rec2 family competence protein [Hyphomicrobiaceae bacterium]
MADAAPEPNAREVADRLQRPQGRPGGMVGFWLAASAHVEAERPGAVLWWPVLMGAGALVYLLLEDEPSLAVAIAALLAAAGLRLVAGRTGAGRLAAMGMVAMAIGFVAGKLRVEGLAAPVLGVIDVDVEMTGIVEHAEVRDGGGLRLTLTPLDMRGLPETERAPVRVRVTVKAVAVAPRPGDVVALAARLSPPPGPASPGGYDFARYAYFQGIGAVGYARGPLRSVEAPMPGDGASSNLRDLLRAIAVLRQNITERVTSAAPGPAGAIAAALITGERGAIPDSINEAFRASGLYHILSISGLHMAIMGGSVFFALRAILAAVPRLALVYPIKKWAAVGAILAAFGYLLVSGAAFATLRAFVMLAVMLAAVLVDRPVLALRNVALAASLLLVAFPESIVDPGFQMSFAAVIALVASHEALTRRRGSRESVWPLVVTAPVAWLATIMATTIIASVAIAPLAAYHFGQTQHYAVVGNLLAVPLCNFVVMPAALATLLAMPLGLEAGPLAVMALGIECMIAVAHFVAGLGGAVGRVAPMPDAAIALIGFGGLWLAFLSTRLRWAGFVAVAAGLAAAPFGDRPDGLVSARGDVIAVRGADGRLAFAGARSDDFTIERWLARDGDGRSAEAVAASMAECRDGPCVMRLAARRNDEALRIAEQGHLAGERREVLQPTEPAGGAGPDGSGAANHAADNPGSEPLVAQTTAEQMATPEPPSPSAATAPSTAGGDIVVALVRRGADVGAACRQAAVVVYRWPIRGACRGPSLVLDGRALGQRGAASIAFQPDGTLRVTRARPGSGTRPWTAEARFSPPKRSGKRRTRATTEPAPFNDPFGHQAGDRGRSDVQSPPRSAPQ